MINIHFPGQFRQNIGVWLQSIFYALEKTGIKDYNLVANYLKGGIGSYIMNNKNSRSKDMYNSYLSINIHNIAHNANVIYNSLPPGTMLIPVLKCDAYGLGLTAVADALTDTGMISTIAVAQMNEALVLREGGFKGDILVMGAAVNAAQIIAAAENGITLTAYRPGFLFRCFLYTSEKRLKIKRTYKNQLRTKPFGLLIIRAQS